MIKSFAGLIVNQFGINVSLRTVRINRRYYENIAYCLFRLGRFDSVCPTASWSTSAERSSERATEWGSAG